MSKTNRSRYVGATIVWSAVCNRKRHRRKYRCVNRVLVQRYITCDAAHMRWFTIADDVSMSVGGLVGRARGRRASQVNLVQHVLLAA